MMEQQKSKRTKNEEEEKKYIVNFAQMKEIEGKKKKEIDWDIDEDGSTRLEQMQRETRRGHT